MASSSRIVKGQMFFLSSRRMKCHKLQTTTLQPKPSRAGWKGRSPTELMQSLHCKHTNLS